MLAPSVKDQCWNDTAIDKARLIRNAMTHNGGKVTGELGSKYGNEYGGDQPFFTLAMEQLNFNPYTLSISYNYRGCGDGISGLVRIWHSHGKMPENINQFKVVVPLRRAWPSKLIQPNNNIILKILKSKVYWFFKENITTIIRILKNKNSN